MFGGDTLGYDPEERLVSVTAGSSTLLANAYDGAGMRAIKTTALGTTYFLDDASGSPVVEETYSTSPMPTTTLSKIDAWGADGLRERYTVTGGGSETFYLYDPQGTVVSRIVSSDPAVHNDGEVFTDLCVFDGYGQQRSDQWTGRTVDQQYSPDDPVGFEGQAGYYQDWEIAKSSNPAQYVYLITTPSLLTRRYYDASTGRFVNRDPIDYQGGENLYGYCGGNPVNEDDPEGEAGKKPVDEAYLLSRKLIPGKYAGKYVDVPARLTNVDSSKVPIALIRENIANGEESGCHTCGDKQPAEGFAFDHQPPSQLNPNMASQRAYPQCIPCSRSQGGTVGGLVRGNKKITIVIKAIEDFWSGTAKRASDAAEGARGLGEHAGLIGGLFILEDYSLRNRDHSFGGFVNSFMNATAPGPVFDLRYLLPENQHPVPRT